MAYHEILADRVREIISQSHTNIEEKKMFGGLCFMVNDKMCIGVKSDRIMVRLDPALFEEVMEKEGCHAMQLTGRSVKGFVFVAIEVVSTTKELGYWVGLALSYNERAKSSRKKKK